MCASGPSLYASALRTAPSFLQKPHVECLVAENRPARQPLKVHSTHGDPVSTCLNCTNDIRHIQSIFQDIIFDICSPCGAQSPSASSASLSSIIINHHQSPPSINQSINQPTNQPINQSINQSTNQSINQPTTQSINQPTNQPINQSTNQSINQSIIIIIIIIIAIVIVIVNRHSSIVNRQSSS